MKKLTRSRRHTTLMAVGVTTSLIAAAGALAPAAQADVPPMPQGYPIAHLYEKCSAEQAHADGYPEWHYGETGRRYLSDGTIQFTNRTKQKVPYTATVETGVNHKIEANSAAALPSGWNTTAKSDIGIKLSNGWIEGETFGPFDLESGESIRIEYGTVEKEFISMFLTCDGGHIVNERSANVIRGRGPAERYAFVYKIKADGSISDQAMKIPSRTAGANSRPMKESERFNSWVGPSLEKVADDHEAPSVPPATKPQHDPSWPTKGQSCKPRGVQHWYPNDVTQVSEPIRKAGYSTQFRNWSKADYVFKPVTDFVVGAEYNGVTFWMDNGGRLPQGWLQSTGAAQRAYMPVGTALKPVNLKPGEKVTVNYGTMVAPLQYSEISCGKDGTYSRVKNQPLASAPVGFWAEAVITASDGSTRKVDVTPDNYRKLPVPTQSDF